MITPGDMIARIEAGFRKTAFRTGRSAPSAAVIGAMRRVARTAFVRRSDRDAAHEDLALPIGHGQTISQPYIVALMVELLDLAPTSRVLEVGTGSGYAAAVLAEIAEAVFTIESVEPLARRAATRLARLGYRNVQVRHGDGTLGWPGAAPFDGIVVSAAARQIPDALVEQLAAPGVLIAPVGAPDTEQDLIRLTKDDTGHVTRESILPVVFVPLLTNGV
ncbi:MAG: protein-L-isoaspartate(D-aspartate) O-methyltransferase [Planctomycetota bacterium]|nr:protein-L-isoaspartate(D-aspartate) O-methyltransferase [Planctomycetota bacterium]